MRKNASKRNKQKLENELVWETFKSGSLPKMYLNSPQIVSIAKQMNISQEKVLKEFDDINEQEDVWLNNLYQVNIRKVNRNREPTPNSPNVIHLSIKRLDKAPIHDWRDLQRIKNELVGPEYEAVEIYPAEDRLVDTANQYHLWVFDDPDFRLDFGFGKRVVTSEAPYNGKQRSLQS